MLLTLLLTAGGCAGQPWPSEPPSCEPCPSQAPVEPPSEPLPAPPDEADVLLGLTGEVLRATTAEERRAIEAERREAFEAQPTHDNLLRLTLVRALSAALPAELEEVRNDLRVLVNGREELSNNQRHLAMLALLLVSERLALGSQITELQRKIDSLTEIEASLNGASEVTP